MKNLTEIDLSCCPSKWVIDFVAFGQFKEHSHVQKLHFLRFGHVTKNIIKLFPHTNSLKFDTFKELDEDHEPINNITSLEVGTIKHRIVSFPETVDNRIVSFPNLKSIAFTVNGNLSWIPPNVEKMDINYNVLLFQIRCDKFPIFPKLWSLTISPDSQWNFCYTEIFGILRLLPNVLLENIKHICIKTGKKMYRASIKEDDYTLQPLKCFTSLETFEIINCNYKKKIEKNDAKCIFDHIVTVSTYTINDIKKESEKTTAKHLNMLRKLGCSQAKVEINYIAPDESVFQDETVEGMNI